MTYDIYDPASPKGLYQALSRSRSFYPSDPTAPVPFPQPSPATAMAGIEESDDFYRMVRKQRYFHPENKNQFQSQVRPGPLDTSSFQVPSRFVSGLRISEVPSYAQNIHGLGGEEIGAGLGSLDDSLADKELRKTLDTLRAQRNQIPEKYQYIFDFLIDWSVWLDKANKDLNDWAEILASMYSSGFLTCGQVVSYNSRALAFWGVNTEIIQKFRKLAEDVPAAEPLLKLVPIEAPMPTLFAHSVKTRYRADGSVDILPDLVCDDIGFLQPGANFQTPVTRKTAEQTCSLEAAQVIPMLLWAIVITLGAIVVKIVGDDIVDPIVKGITGEWAAEKREAWNKLEFERQKAMAAYVRDCVARALADNPNMSASEKMKITLECHKVAEETFPTGQDPVKGLSFLSKIIIGAAVIGGIWLIGKWMSKHKTQTNGIRLKRIRRR